MQTPPFIEQYSPIVFVYIYIQREREIEREKERKEFYLYVYVSTRVDLTQCPLPGFSLQRQNMAYMASMEEQFEMACKEGTIPGAVLLASNRNGGLSTPDQYPQYPQ